MANDTITVAALLDNPVDGMYRTGNTIIIVDNGVPVFSPAGMRLRDDDVLDILEGGFTHVD